MQDILTPSVDLLDCVYDAQARQDWYREHIIDSGGDPLSFVGSLKLSDNNEVAARRIRESVGWSNDLGRLSTSWETALSLFIDLVRDSGVIVIRSGIVGNNTRRSLSVSEFRGFSLSDKYAPLIFINSNDAKAAQLFTLAHELVHIWLGESGVSNLRLTYSPNVSIERFCNSVAAEVLVPLAELKREWGDRSIELDDIAQIARNFKVSKLVIMRRLRDAEFLTEDDFQTFYTDELAQITQRSMKEKDQGGGGDFYATTRSRFGDRFLYALLGSTFEGKTSYHEAMRLLGVSKSETVRELSNKLGIQT